MRVERHQGDVSETEDRISRLRSEHQTLDRRLSELNRHAYLTPTEQVEAVEIKKEKLRRKDLIQLLQSRGN